MVWLFVLSGIVAIFGALAAYTAYAVRRFRRAQPPSGRFLTVDGVRLHFVDQGQGSPVVFVPGSAGVVLPSRSMVPMAAAQGIRAIAFDRPGHGWSGRPRERLTVALNSRLIHSVVRELGIARPILVGHSYGGAVALRYALDFPEEVRALVLVAPVAYAQGSGASRLAALTTTPVLGAFLLHTLGVLLGRRLSRASSRRSVYPDALDETLQEEVEALTVQPKQLKALAEEELSADTDLRAMEDRFPTIRVPVTIIAGEQDVVVKPDRHARSLHRAIPHSKLVTVPDTGHSVQLKHPDTVLEAIDEVAV